MRAPVLAAAYGALLATAYQLSGGSLVAPLAAQVLGIGLGVGVGVGVGVG